MKTKTENKIDQTHQFIKSYYGEVLGNVENLKYEIEEKDSLLFTLKNENEKRISIYRIKHMLNQYFEEIENLKRVDTILSMIQYEYQKILSNEELEKYRWRSDKPMDFDLDLSDNEIYEEELTSSKVGNWYSWDEVNK